MTANGATANVDRADSLLTELQTIISLRTTTHPAQPATVGWASISNVAGAIL